MSIAVQNDNLYDNLQTLAETGIRLMPVVPGAKTPAWRNWQFGRDGRPYGKSSATTDLDRLTKLVERGVPTGFGMPTGQPYRGLYLNGIDIDPRHGGDESMAELVDKIGPPPVTATVKTLNGGTHHWVLSPIPWMDAPKEIARGVEWKRAGQFLMVPPSNGYSFVVSPYGEPEEAGISSWSEWDALLGMAVAAKASGAPSMLEASNEVPSKMDVVPRLESWCSTDDYLRAIATATPGNRTEALLRFGGKVAWATAMGVGLAGPQAVASALWRACETSGLVDDYDASELERKIGKYVTWSDPSQNPLLLRREQGRRHHPVLNPLQWGRTAEARHARQAVLMSLGKFARMEFRPYAASYGEAWTGIPATTVQRALSWLRDQGLIERGPSAYSGRGADGKGKRPTHTYRVTPLGKLALRGLGDAA